MNYCCFWHCYYRVLGREKMFSGKMISVSDTHSKALWNIAAIKFLDFNRMNAFPVNNLQSYDSMINFKIKISNIFSLFHQINCNHGAFIILIASWII